MPTIVGLLCVGGLIAVGALAVATANSRLVYGASLLVTLSGLVTALWHLIAGGDAATVSLPLGLPGIGAHFRLDALSAFFLAVANLGGATASLYGLGYGEHEPAPYRVLPFFPIYLADGPIDRPALEWLHERRLRDVALADAVLVPSDHIAGWLTRNGTPARRVRVVPYAADTRRFVPLAKDSTSSGRCTFLFTGGIVQVPSMIEGLLSSGQYIRSIR